jgi:predicted outer membrane protein
LYQRAGQPFDADMFAESKSYHQKHLNLLYRRKADTVDSAAERARLTEMANELLDKVKEIKTKQLGKYN